MNGQHRRQLELIETLRKEMAQKPRMRNDSRDTIGRKIGYHVFEKPTIIRFSAGARSIKSPY